MVALGAVETDSLHAAHVGCRKRGNKDLCGEDSCVSARREWWDCVLMAHFLPSLYRTSPILTWQQKGCMGLAPTDVQCMRYMLTVVGMGTGGLVELVVLLIS